MANRYWVGGTGTWDSTSTANWSATSGGAAGASAPTSADVANIDASSGSGTITITSTATCLYPSINNAGITCSLSGHAALGSTLNLVAGTFDCGPFNLTQTSAFNVGGSSTFICNGGVITGTTFSQNSASSTVQLNNSTLIFSSSVSFGAGTFDAGTSSITTNGGTWSAVSGKTFYNVTIGTTSTVTFNAGLTFNNLTLKSIPSVSARQVVLGGGLTVNGTLTFEAPTVPGASRYVVQSNLIGTPRTLTASAVSLVDVDFLDITNPGTTWTGTRLGDCGGNTGITFDAPKTVWWNLAGSNNFSANGWATTQTGTPNTTQFPLPQDTAKFSDTNPAASATVTAVANYQHPSLDFSARTAALTFAAGTSAAVYGDFIGSSALTQTGTLDFKGRNTTQNITSAGGSMGGITVNAIGGTVKLLDNLTATGNVTLTYGTLDVNNKNVTCGNFSSNNTSVRTFSMGSGTWTIGSWNTAQTANLTFDKSTANIILNTAGTTAYGFSSGGLTFNNLTIAGTGTGSVSFNGNTTFATLSHTKTVAYTVSFTAGTTTTVANWGISGSAGAVVTIRSPINNQRFTLQKSTAGPVTVDYINIKDSIASPGYTWVATNSTDSGNNQNWYFGALPAFPSCLFFGSNF